MRVITGRDIDVHITRLVECSRPDSVVVAVVVGEIQDVTVNLPIHAREREGALDKMRAGSFA
jgi:hypothetical protein